MVTDRETHTVDEQLILAACQQLGMAGDLMALFAKLLALGERVIAPLRTSDDMENFRLSIPETHTTTIDGTIGWAKRPPAMLTCPRCGGNVQQDAARDAIDCPHCVAEFSYEEFTELELQHMTCPVCGTEMEHGQRHPEQLDVPEWATCNECNYHWEFKHFF